MKKSLSVFMILALLSISFFVSCTDNQNYDRSTDVPDSEETTSFETAAYSSENETEITETDTSAETMSVMPIESGSEEDSAEAEPKEEVTEETENNVEQLGYIAPEGWYAPRFETEKVGGGDYILEYGVMGLKVYYVQKKLGVRPATWGYYYEPTMDVVSFFQAENGLEANGTVDLDTWLTLGFTKDEWYNLSSYVTPVESTPSSTAAEMREIIVNTAEKYVGTPYVVGASGKPGEGVDCSGLALQCMYAAGIYPDGLNPVQHATVEEYNSRLMWADPKFKEISRGDLQPGDLVFYSRPWSRVVCHVAIYVGDGMCIEALSGEVEYLFVDKDDEGFAIVGFKTMFCE